MARDQTHARVLVAFGRIRALALVVGVVGCGGCLPTVPGRSDSERLRIQMEGLEAWGFSGAVYVERNGQVLLEDGFGQASLNHDVPVTAGTIFDIGSVSKQFTAASVLLLCDRGLLSVEDSLGGLFDKAPPDKRGITIHQLLTHTSGLPREIGQDFQVMSRDDLVRSTLAADLRFRPGEGYGYSNAGYALLAAIVERTSKMSFHDLLESEIFARAGLRSTGFIGRSPDRDRTGLAIYGPLIGQNPSDWPHTWNNRGPGGVLSTVGDLARWWHALRDGRVISAESVDAMFTPHERGYGYGIVRDDGPFGPAFGHTGVWYAFSSQLEEIPDSGALLIALSNGRRETSQPANLAVRVLEDALFKPSTIPPPLLAVDPKPNLALQGRYVTDEGGEITVRVTDDALLIDGAGQDVFDAIFSVSEPPPDLTQMLRARSTAILRGIGAEDFDTLRVAAPRERYERYRRVLPPIWANRTDSLGPLETVSVVGVIDRVGALDVVASLGFQHGSERVILTWSRAGLLLGLRNDNPPIDADLVTFRKTRTGDWAAFHNDTRKVVRLGFDSAGLTVADGGGRARLRVLRATVR